MKQFEMSAEVQEKFHQQMEKMRARFESEEWKEKMEQIQKQFDSAH